MPPLRIRSKVHPGDVGSKEHTKRWGLPKDVQPPFSTFTRDPNQYIVVRPERMGRFVTHSYGMERTKEMERETEKVSYSSSTRGIDNMELLTLICSASTIKVRRPPRAFVTPLSD